MRLKTKLVLAITALVLLISGLLSLIYVSQLLHASVEQSYKTNRIFANQVQLAVKDALSTGLKDRKFDPSKPQELRDMGFHAWRAHVSAQGTVKETTGAVNVPISLGGQVIRPGDAIVADDDGVCVVPRLNVTKAVAASEAPIAKEDANRKQLADGKLGLDMYGLRPKLAKIDYITYAEYVRRAGEGA